MYGCELRISVLLPHHSSNLTPITRSSRRSMSDTAGSKVGPMLSFCTNCVTSLIIWRIEMMPDWESLAHSGFPSHIVQDEYTPALSSFTFRAGFAKLAV